MGPEGSAIGEQKKQGEVSQALVKETLVYGTCRVAS